MTRGIEHQRNSEKSTLDRLSTITAYLQALMTIYRESLHMNLTGYALGLIHRIRLNLEKKTKYFARAIDKEDSQITMKARRTVENIISDMSHLLEKRYSKDRDVPPAWQEKAQSIIIALENEAEMLFPGIKKSLEMRRIENRRE